MNSPKILITTSDYLPQLGGLTSFCLNLESCLKQLNLNYELWHWKSENKKDLDFSNFDLVFNIHYQGGVRLRGKLKPMARVVNFVHGSEILFTSPNLIKKAVKKLLKPSHMRFFETSYHNVFISNFTYEKLSKIGYRQNYFRDIVFPNCINTEQGTFEELNITGDELNLICIARDVPHKNIEGVVKFAGALGDISNKKIKLYVTSKRKSDSRNVEILNIQDISNEKRDELYKKSHFNLLFSLDHSIRGFYEGFGLSILEGNIYGCPGIVMSSGGLPENVHDEFNGFVINEVNEKEVKRVWEKSQIHYRQLRKNSFEHVMKFHSLTQFSKLVSSFVEQSILEKSI